MTDSHPPFSTSPTHVESDRAISFSGWLTAFSFLVCLAGMGILGWSLITQEVPEPGSVRSADLERLASRTLGFESRLLELSLWEQTIYDFFAQGQNSESQIRQWYEDLRQDDPSPLNTFYLGVMLGEAGLTSELMTLHRELSEDSHGGTRFLPHFLEEGYLNGSSEGTDTAVLQAHLAEQIPGNWFYFRMARRLADRSGDQALGRSLQAQFVQLTNPYVWKWRGLLLVELGVVVVGGGVLLRRLTHWVRKREKNFGDSSHSLLGLWSGKEGMAVLVRGGALSIVGIGILGSLPQGPEILEDFGSFFLYLPPVVVGYVYFCHLKQVLPEKVLGVSLLVKQGGKVFSTVFMVMALGLLGDWVIMKGGEFFTVSVHWTEWFVPQLVWGTQAELFKTGIEFILVAPIFEELIFRGMLYRTFRAFGNRYVAMFGSAFLFAFMHGYGFVGFFAVLWSGILWAWAYERTGSLIPGILAHAINNAFAVYSLVAFYR